MAEDLIRYDLLVQDAMRGVMRRVLADVAVAGELPGEHHFTIIFRTDAPGVKISNRLKAEWPQQMTIILQYQFADLAVDDEGFGVTLFFRGVREHLHVPFVAVTGFFDPSVEFGLRFDNADEAEEDENVRPGPHLVRETAEPVKAEKTEKRETAPDDAADEEVATEEKPRDAKIVSIDAFRKKT